MAEYAIDALMDDTAQAQYGFLALAQLFTTGITIMRQQSRLVWGYVAVAAAAALVSRPLVGALGIAGASAAYIACMAVLAAWFAALFLRCSRRA